MEAFLYINCMIRVLFVASRDRLWINRFIASLGITALYISRERKVCIAQKYDSRIGSSVTLARHATKYAAAVVLPVKLVLARKLDAALVALFLLKIAVKPAYAVFPAHLCPYFIKQSRVFERTYR